MGGGREVGAVEREREGGRGVWVVVGHIIDLYYGDNIMQAVLFSTSCFLA